MKSHAPEILTFKFWSLYRVATKRLNDIKHNFYKHMIF